MQSHFHLIKNVLKSKAYGLKQYHIYENWI